MVRDPDTEVVRDALEPDRVRDPGRAGGGAVTNVVMLSPGYPQEMAYFTRGLAAVGATVIGVGDQPRDALPAAAREALPHYEHVSLADEGAVLAALRGLSQHVAIDQVECLWEPYMVLAARIREALGLPGMTVEQTLPFRDKELMKQVLDAAGIRTPRHASTTTRGGRLGGRRADRLPADRQADRGRRVGRHLPRRLRGGARRRAADAAARARGERRGVRRGRGVHLRHRSAPAAEILFEHVLWYRPRPLQMRAARVGQPGRDLAARPRRPAPAGRPADGHEVLAALGFQSGFTHMEWYRKDDGEVVFGEIGARPPGVRVVDMMNYDTDGDLYVGWAERRRARPDATRSSSTYNVGSIFKRAHGVGHIIAVAGPGRAARASTADVVLVDLLPVGAHRRDWRATTDRRRHRHRPPPGAPAGHRDDRALRLRAPAARPVSPDGSELRRGRSRRCCPTCAPDLERLVRIPSVSADPAAAAHVAASRPTRSRGS